MAHWSERYVGRPYCDGSADCADLVMEVLLNEFGIEMKLPGDRNWRRQTPETIAGMAGGFAQPTDSPQEGDGVLMRIIGRRWSLGGHIGLLCVIAGRRWALHSMKTTGSVLCPVTQLHTHHLEAVGYYRWIR